MKSTLAASALALAASGCGPVSHGSNNEASLDGAWGFPIRSAIATRLPPGKSIDVLLSESVSSTCHSAPSLFESYRSVALHFKVGAPGAAMLMRD